MMINIDKDHVLIACFHPLDKYLGMVLYHNNITNWIGCSNGIVLILAREYKGEHAQEADKENSKEKSTRS